MNIEFISDSYTEDGLKLPMVHFESNEHDICVICIHGMCGTIVDNYFATVWGKILSEKNIGFIYEHNRGHSIENDMRMKDRSCKRYGTRYEIFEESLIDIDTAIETAYKKGYKRIILLGHSLGCNKVIYYYYKRKPNIIGVILASAPDIVGTHKRDQPDYMELLREAKINIDNKEPTKLLHKMIEDYMYMSSATYYNWYHENSNLDNLPVLENPEHWEQLASLEVPILTFSGGREEDSYLQLELLKEKALACKNFTYKVINDTGHTYYKKEEETGFFIYSWIEKNFL